MKAKNKPNPFASRGRRYSPAERAQILQDAEDTSVREAAEKHRCTAWIIYDWRKKDKRRAKQERDGHAPDNEPATSELSQQQRQEKVLETWREQPGLGPSQIRNQLKRKKLRISVNSVRAIMEEHGYVHPKTRRKEKTGRYEALRPLQLVHLDFYHFYVHRQKQCLLFILDDFSRYITGSCLIENEQADGVIEAFEESITRYGKPEAAMSDRGSAFHSWKGLSRFEALLEEYGIDRYLATKPQVNGKVEALNASFQKELLRQVEFTDLSDARRQIDRWIEFYNYKRTHHALGGLLVPADRFHGFEQETLRRIEQGEGADLLDLLHPEGRGLELFKVTSQNGQPAIYLMGRKILG